MPAALDDRLSGIEHHLHQIRLSRIQARKPRWALIQRRNRRDERRNFDLPARRSTPSPADTLRRKRRSPAGESAASPPSAAEWRPRARCCRPARPCRLCARSRLRLLTVSGRPTASKTTSTPRPPVSSSIREVRDSASEPSMIGIRTQRSASSRRVASTSATKMREQPERAAACRMSKPIMPAPMTSTVSPPFDFSNPHRMHRDGDRFEHCRIGKGQACPADDTECVPAQLRIRQKRRRGDSRRRRRPRPGDGRRGSLRRAGRTHTCRSRPWSRR